ncbi:glycine betaine ABC transporter substrate-binding protein [Phytoactinopolyspora mesophila]|uniref:Glycine/betaine ABC transporter substrate-binding protein n=1 Tax=Phytoactinopolyspora mesophila TaxID=2650750 RepID=A0A7K3M1W0_9ACTN|nr:glycine betaine ABC transporter substrate-binding protein [Phytoactinopolyspora mesophila]NDL57230.1 glycine/betaine ABC transporter substrate-binding protein [Phytoactinopolyspora mesophila]
MYYWKRIAASAAVVALALAACNGDDADVAVGDDIEEELGDLTITVGSKEFTEQRILGQIAIVALEAAGADVRDETGIEGTPAVRSALETGEIDLYWEYTGTGWSAILGHEIAEAPTDTQELYEAVREEDAENGIIWFDPAPVNNTYAIASAPGVASGLGVSTLSDYADLVRDNPEEASLCAAAEFLVRDDGLPGMEETYDFEMPSGQVEEMELGIIHTRLPQSDPCNFGEVFATDGQIITNELEVLEDDQGAFPPYNLAVTVREDVYDEAGEALEELFNPITAALTDELLREMNARSADDPGFEDEIAEEFLRDHGFID